MPTIYSSTPNGALQGPKSGDGLDRASPTLEVMKAAQRWLVWKYGPKLTGKKPRKLPHYVGGRPRSKPLDVESDWKLLVGFEEAVAFCKAHPEYRVGFALGPDGKGYWQGLDFDNTLQGADELPGYVERSPSGAGYHGIGYGQHFHAYTEKFEAYSSGRFFTFTGEQINDGPPHDFSASINRYRAKQDEHIAAVEQEVRGYSLEQLLDAVTAIPNDDLHWELWNKIGMALWAAAGEGGRARAFCAWVTFSAKSDKLFDARETLDRWEHYERSPATRLGAGTIIWLARQAGWKTAPAVEHKTKGRLINAPGPFTGEEEPDEFVIENFILVGLAVLYGP